MIAAERGRFIVQASLTGWSFYLGHNAAEDTQPLIIVFPVIKQWFHARKSRVQRPEAIAHPLQ